MTLFYRGGGVNTSLFEDLDITVTGDVVSISRGANNSGETVEVNNPGDSAENFLNALIEALSGLLKNLSGTSDNANSSSENSNVTNNVNNKEIQDRNVTGFDYDKPNSTVQRKDKDGNNLTYIYDEKGKLSYVNDDSGRIILSMCTLLDGKTEVSKFKYNESGELVSIITRDKNTNKISSQVDFYRNQNGERVKDTIQYNEYEDVTCMYHEVTASNGSKETTVYDIDENGMYTIKTVNYHQKDNAYPSKVEVYVNGKLDSINHYNKNGEIQTTDKNPICRSIYL